MPKNRLNELLAQQRIALMKKQKEDGHWVYPLEADVTMPAEYIMMEHIIGRIEDDVEAGLANYIRRRQGRDGGWALYHGGASDLSATVRAYIALKLVGDSRKAQHMKKARTFILDAGGAGEANVFARFFMAMFGFVPWRALPVMPVELMLVPRWFWFHLDKVSYWSRVLIVPLMVLMVMKPRGVNPRCVTIDELFPVPPCDIKEYNKNVTDRRLGTLFLWLDKTLRLVEPPSFLRKRAIDRAVDWCMKRREGQEGIGGILPAMVCWVFLCHFKGYDREKPPYRDGLVALRKMVTQGERADELICQPCLSPVWDTALAMQAQLEAGIKKDDGHIQKAAAWLIEREVRLKGDWVSKRPTTPAGGWAFQYRNDYYPDVDDTAVVGIALDRLDDPRHEPALRRAEKWIIGMQSKNGGWGAFDADNTHYYFNHIPFNDHGALLDPPTSDVTARCVSFLAQRGYKRSHPVMRKALDYLKKEQEKNGSWFGRWGTNYIYGTWSVLCALNAIGEDMTQKYVQDAIAWLLHRQNQDGGWGESCLSYHDNGKDCSSSSTPSQTSWALMALMAAGEVEHAAVRQGIEYLQKTAPQNSERWKEDDYTAVGFPRVFYLRYHGYSAYFPQWALARYHNLKSSNARASSYAM